MPGDTKVIEASSTALQRPTNQAYEPIVVEIEPYIYRILDVHHLLTAQCHIHQLASNLLHELYQELEAANQKLELQASLDALTQVANRRRFDEYLAQQWLQMSKQQSPISIIMADIDCFKGYNDTYGHQAGDKCIKQVALAINQAVQMTINIKKENNLVARYGGEEFAIVLPQMNAIDAVSIAEQIRSHVKSLNITHKASVASKVVTLSLGVSTAIPQLGGSREALIAEADRALYQAKIKGRDRVLLS